MNNLTSYVVEWSIDIDADTPEAAARQAFEIMQRKGTTATVFTVTAESGDAEQIDLTEINEERNAQ